MFNSSMQYKYNFCLMKKIQLTISVLVMFTAGISEDTASHLRHVGHRAQPPKCRVKRAQA